MKTYWDFSDKERASMTREQVNALLAVELMQHGLTKPEPPTLEPVPSVADLPQTTYFGVEADGEYSSQDVGVYFDTIEQAQAFAELKPIDKRSDYRTSVCRAKRLTNFKIITKQMPSEADYMALQPQLAEAATIKSRNEAKTRDYQIAVDKCDKAVKSIWSDWDSQQQSDMDAKSVLRTFDEFVRLSEGDERIAMKFLGKRYSEDEITQAFAWCDRDLPSMELVDACVAEECPSDVVDVV